MKATKFFLIGALALVLTGCAGAKRDAITALYFGEPTAEQCEVVAKIGVRAESAGDKAEVAKQTSVVASPLYAPLASIAGVIDVITAGGEAVYESGANKYKAKCK